MNIKDLPIGGPAAMVLVDGQEFDTLVPVEVEVRLPFTNPATG